VSFPGRLLIAASLALGVAGTIASCSTSNTATTYTPYTGIDVPTASVVGGVGCTAPDGGPGGIDHWVALLTYAIDSGSFDAIPSGGIVAAGVFSCFTPAATFENIDASATYDVWVLGFPPGVPADLPCDAGTCVLSGSAAFTAMQQDQQEALVALRCLAVGESGSHPRAYGCEPFGPTAPLDSGPTPDAAGDGSASDAASSGDASADGSSAGDAGSD
jgi:hypothetical protein